MATTIEETLHVPLRRISADEYHRMGEAGILGSDERVELLDGLLIEMSPIGNRHLYAVRVLTDMLTARYAKLAIVDVQSPVHLGPGSEPEPDLMLLRRPHERYAERKPIAADVYLLIEVADSSVAFDTGPKLRTYAEAGIREVWVVDLVDEVLRVFIEPHADGYAVRRMLRRGDAIAPSAFPHDPLPIREFLLSVAGGKHDEL
jgi:Uma2 family endonuclease